MEKIKKKTDLNGYQNILLDDDQDDNLSMNSSKSQEHFKDQKIDININKDQLDKTKLIDVHETPGLCLENSNNLSPTSHKI